MLELKNSLERKQNSSGEFFTLLGMIYITMTNAANVLIYKVVTIHAVNFSVGSLIVPSWFVIGDAVAEVYGYHAIRRLIWYGIICSFLFTATCASLISFHSPPYWHYQDGYQLILGNLPRIFFGSLVGLFMGSFCNAYLISKWKILVRGKVFWLRSLGSSWLGELIFTVTTLMIDMYKIFPYHEILHFILISYLIKIAATMLAIIPSSILVILLKKHENIDVYDYQTDFNPFKMAS